jgi:hypothetical protein
MMFMFSSSSKKLQYKHTCVSVAVSEIECIGASLGLRILILELVTNSLLFLDFLNVISAE